MRQRAVEQRNHLRRCAFLRPKYRRRSVITDQRIRHITGNINPALRQARIQAADVNLCQRRQSRTAGRNRLTVSGQQLRAKRLHHTCAAVVSGATANADNHPRHAKIQRMANQLSGAP